MRWAQAGAAGGHGQAPPGKRSSRQGRPLISSWPAARSGWPAPMGVRTSPARRFALQRWKHTRDQLLLLCDSSVRGNPRSTSPRKRDPTSPTASCSLQSAPPKPSETTPISYGTAEHRGEHQNRNQGEAPAITTSGNVDAWLLVSWTV